MTELCNNCARKQYCGNNTTMGYCTGFVKNVEIRTCKTINTNAQIFTYDNKGKPFVIKFTQRTE